MLRVREMPNWSNLPIDVIEAISKGIVNGVDYVRFRSVCMPWRSSTPKKPQFPWLGVEHEGELGLYDFPESHLVRPQLPIIGGKVICGSSRGWICVLDRTPSISLHNPFTGAKIQLPPLADLLTDDSSDCCRIYKVDGGSLIDGRKQAYFKYVGASLANKVILSADPSASPADCVVMGLMHFGEKLVFLLPGSDRWMVPRLPDDLGDPFQDILYYENRFYAVSGTRVFVCDPRTDAEVKEIPSVGPPLNQPPSEDIQYELYSHLVESSGDLLLLRTGLGFSRDPCEVYRADVSGGFLRLSKVKNLGGRSLFLDVTSMSVSASSLPGSKPNQIYSIQRAHTLEGYHNRSSPRRIFLSVLCVFDVEDGTCTIPEVWDETLENSWTALWLTPSLWN